MSIGDGKYAPVDEMTPEVHAYWEGRAESSAEIQALKDALREAVGLIGNVRRRNHKPIITGRNYEDWFSDAADLESRTTELLGETV